MNRQQYERTIQGLRTATAAFFAVGGTGIVVCANLSVEAGVYLSLLMLLFGFAMLVLLILDQLTTVWLMAWRGRISIAGLLLLTCGASLVFAIYRSSAGLAVFLLCVLVTIGAACLEWRRHQPDEPPAES